MNDQETTPAEEEKDLEELGKQKLRKMFEGFKDLVQLMGENTEKMKKVQEKHATALAQIKNAPGLAASEIPMLEDRVNAILDIVSSLADAQILALDMGQKQLTMTMNQLNELAGLEE